MADLQTDVRYIKGIGEQRAKALARVGVTTLRELIGYFPRSYEDRTQIYPIAQLPEGEEACCVAMIAAEPVGRRITGGRSMVRLRAVDESGVLDVTFFNQEYRKSSLHTGETYIFYGKAEGTARRRQMVNPLMERQESQRLTGRIMPVYPLTHGVSQLMLGQAVRQGLDECRELLEDVLPDEVRQQHKLCYVNFAYENIHFPASFEALEVARRRLVFEELFLLTCGLQLLRHRRQDVAGPACHAVDMDGFYSVLPFPLTEAQRRAIDDAIGDMTRGRPMNRLVQGDVGSGKTMVAAACIWFAAQNGWQSTLMAPTEILARQHYDNLAPLFAAFGLHVALLTGSTKAKERRAVLEGLALGQVDLCVGTHALLTEDVQYANLGLVITDEQHRFGVNQRSALIGKGTRPHVLVMSATPIPRTLALILYGDLDVSILDELPPGRQKVDTFAVDESYRARLNGFIRKLALEGRQIFVVCPMVEENEELPQELKSAEEHAKELQEAFPELKVACVHGRLKPKEKEAVMAAFVSGETDVLVSTTVIEVGVDVPNAALMVVENAERFGLSQLHQLRGRVGRGKHKSWCILVSDAQGEEVRARLDILCKSNDGFKVAEEDLRLRGPGDFFGSRQSGLPEMHVADLGADAKILQRAQQAALQLLRDDPELTLPEHQALHAQVERLFRSNADSFN